MIKRNPKGNKDNTFNGSKLTHNLLITHTTDNNRTNQTKALGMLGVKGKKSQEQRDQPPKVDAPQGLGQAEIEKGAPDERFAALVARLRREGDAVCELPAARPTRRCQPNRRGPWQGHWLQASRQGPNGSGPAERRTAHA